jgi:predicted O-methyltransferase YrrM
VVTLELAADKADFARQRVSEAGLEDYVEFKIGDAFESIAALAEPLDSVLIDLWTDLCVACLGETYPHLCTGALLAADNILAPDSARARRTTSLP